MARATYRVLKFACLTCSTEQSKGCWLYHDEFDQDKNTAFPDSCTNTTCTDPHIMYIPRRSSVAQVRAEQRCAVYVYPDGDYAATEDNDPRGESAKIAAAAGGVRMEFNSVSELRDFQRKRMFAKREQWQKDIDNGKYYDEMFGVDMSPDFARMQDASYESGRNQVLEYDEKSLREGRDRIREAIAERQAKHRESMSRFKSVRVGRAEDQGRYERLKERERNRR